MLDLTSFNVLQAVGVGVHCTFLKEADKAVACFWGQKVPINCESMKRKVHVNHTPAY
jgi:hypothetical protein